MKVISIYNEKGGSAKSTFTCLLASYLQYKHNIKVLVIDIDERLTHDRTNELKIYPEYKDKTIWNVSPGSIIRINREMLKHNLKFKNTAEWFEFCLKTHKFDKYDLIIIDFPGAIDDFNDFLVRKNISMIAIPIERDQHNFKTSMFVTDLIKKHEELVGNSINFFGFFNKVQTFNKFNIYEELREFHENRGLRILPDIIYYSDRVSKPVSEIIKPEECFRSTLSYPDWSLKVFEGSEDLGIENLMIDLSREILKSPDIKDTVVKDIKFAYDLKKKFHAKRQFRNTMFPEYEFDESYWSQNK